MISYPRLNSTKAKTMLIISNSQFLLPKIAFETGYEHNQISH